MATSDIAEAAADLPSPAIMLQMITGYWISQAIFAAAKLGIADLVKDRPKPCEELARATRVRPKALYRLLRALASIGVFREEEEGHFGLTPLAGYLQTGVPGSLHAYALLQEYQYPMWGGNPPQPADRGDGLQDGLWSGTLSLPH